MDDLQFTPMGGNQQDDLQFTPMQSSHKGGFLGNTVGVGVKALGNLAMIFNHYINNMNPESEDLVVLMKNDISAEKNKTNTSIANCIVTITKLEKVLKKIDEKRDDIHRLHKLIRLDQI